MYHCTVVFYSEHKNIYFTDTCQSIITVFEHRNLRLNIVEVQSTGIIYNFTYNIYIYVSLHGCVLFRTQKYILY